MTTNKESWLARASFAALIVCPIGSLLAARDSGVAPTPPMGWSSWNHFARDVSDAIIRSEADADAMVLSDMKAGGDTYVNIDDC
jgi:alpha-galactosidase